MPKIYRVQDGNGTGMYQRWSVASWNMQECDGFQPRHPRPREDSALVKSVENAGVRFAANLFHYGFSSIEQFKFWVYKGEWREELNEAGFSLVEFEVEQVFYGDTQAVIYADATREVVHFHNLLEV